MGLSPVITISKLATGPKIVILRTRLAIISHLTISFYIPLLPEPAAFHIPLHTHRSLGQTISIHIPTCSSHGICTFALKKKRRVGIPAPWNHHGIEMIWSRQQAVPLFKEVHYSKEVHSAEVRVAMKTTVKIVFFVVLCGLKERISFAGYEYL